MSNALAVASAVLSGSIPKVGSLSSGQRTPSPQDVCWPGWSAISSPMKSFWLVKQEPSSYSWSDFLADGKTSWTGVRNFSARNNLRKMQTGDEVLFYHTGDEKSIVGIVKVIRTAYT